MDTTVLRRASWISRSVLGMLLLWAGPTGCALIPVNITLSSDKGELLLEETLRTGSGLPSWNEGIAAYDKGDYGRAQEVFGELNQRAESESLRAKALYGLACTRLVLAKDKESFEQALSLWAQWRDVAPAETREEDPRMMAPLLQQLLPPGMVAVPAQPRRSVSTSTHEKAIQTKEEEIRSREEEILRLRDQLEALEAIHRSIGEKKKGVTSP